ncbi:MAG: ABC transporter ATP-binding protein [Ruminococcaceae bacterium]|nr:ABC transporter ATP-binding protein [Oscillospiraceae bacterium]
MRKLLRFLKPYRAESVLGPLFKMLEALFELFIPLVVADIIDVGIKSNDTDFIWQRCGIMVALGVIGLVCSITAQYFSAKAAVGMAAGMRRSLFAHIGKLSYAQTDRIGTATLLSRTTADVNQIQNTVNLVLRLFLRSPFIVFGAMIMAFTVSAPAAITFVITIPALSVVIFGIMLISIPLFRRVQGKLDRVLGLTRENLTGARVVRAFVREQESIEEFSAANQELTKLQRFTGRFSALLNPLTYVILNLSILLIIYRGGLQVQLGNLETGQVIALYNYMSQILVELIKLANFIILITKACASASRINEVFDTPAGMTKSDIFEQKNTIKDAPAVVFDKVSFSYHEGGEAALENISFRAPAGSTVGIIGGTGSGKSSLVNLIPRFYDVTSGSVLVNGKDVRHYADPEALRAQIGVVPQKAELFAGTIRENLRWGRENASDEELFKALEAAQAAAFVKEKENGLDFKIEQGGRNLSGGQRQRLTIARALVRRPKILILDDSASALDFATDAALRRSVANLEDHPTTFIVSQRTASIKEADLILVLDDGRIADQGTHEVLLSRCPIYREIYESQFKEVTAE